MIGRHSILWDISEVFTILAGVILMISAAWFLF